MSSLPTRAEGRRDEDREIKYVSPPGVAAFSVIVTHLASKLVQQGSTLFCPSQRSARASESQNQPECLRFYCHGRQFRNLLPSIPSSSNVWALLHRCAGCRRYK